MNFENRFKDRKERFHLAAVIHFLFAGCLLFFNTLACAGPSDSDVLAAIAENGMRRAVDQMAETGGTLATVSESFCQQKDDASLQKAQQAWKDAYIAWSFAAPFRFGPLKELTLNKRIGLWLSNETIFKGVTTSPELSNMLNKPEVRGYPAAEYILFASPDPGADIACNHLVDVTAEIADLTGEAREAWNTYEEGFIGAGDGMPFLMEGEAMSPVLAEVLNTTETLLRDRLGLPSNFFTEQSKPETLQGWYSGTTGVGLQATLNGLRVLLDGAAPNSMVELVATKDGLVKKKNPKLAKAIRKDLDKIDKALTKITSRDESLYDQVAEKPSTMKKVYKQLQVFEEHLVELSTGLELDVKTGLEAQFIRLQNK